MAKKKKSPPAKRKKQIRTKRGPEPKGGPFARREAFLEERMGKLGPKKPDDEEDGPPAREARPQARLASVLLGAGRPPRQRMWPCRWR